MCLKLAVGCRTQGAEGRDRSETEPWWDLLSAARLVGGVCLWHSVYVRPAAKVQRGHCMLNLTDWGRFFANHNCVTWNSRMLHTSVVHLRVLIVNIKLLAQDVNLIKLIQKVYFLFHETNIYQMIKEWCIHLCCHHVFISMLFQLCIIFIFSMNTKDVDRISRLPFSIPGKWMEKDIERIINDLWKFGYMT